jgi:hypothetical protein
MTIELLQPIAENVDILEILWMGMLAGVFVIVLCVLFGGANK